MICSWKSVSSNLSLDETAIRDAIVEKAGRVFQQQVEPEQASLYFGYKTEISGAPLLRNYQYQIVEAGNAVLALPGKLSLAFSLAVNVCRHFGIDPVTDLRFFDGEVPPGAVEEPEHLQRFRQLP